MLKKILPTLAICFLASISFANEQVTDKSKEERIKSFASTVTINFEQKNDREFEFNEKDHIGYEVLYFYSYSCPHCYEFKDYLNEWKKQKGDDVSLHYIPVTFQDNWDITAKAYIIARQLKLNNFDRTIYDRIHKKGYKITSMEDLRDFFYEEYSINTSVFNSLYNGLETNMQIEKFNKLTDDLEIMATPSLVLITRDGRTFLTSPSIANGQANAIFSIEYLMIQDRKIKEKERLKAQTQK